MPDRILDTSRLIQHFQDFRPFAGKTPKEAEDWADQLIRTRGSRDIVSPVEVEFLCVMMDRNELALREAFLSRFRVIDDHKTLPGDWDEARRLARHAGFHTRPRKLGDCLIQAIAERLNRDVDTADSDFDRQRGRTRVGRRKPRRPNG